MLSGLAQSKLSKYHEVRIAVVGHLKTKTITMTRLNFLAGELSWHFWNPFVSMKFVRKQPVPLVDVQRQWSLATISTIHAGANTNWFDQMRSRFFRMQRSLCAQNHKPGTPTKMTKTLAHTDTALLSNDINFATGKIICSLLVPVVWISFESCYSTSSISIKSMETLMDVMLHVNMIKNSDFDCFEKYLINLKREESWNCT